MFEHVFCLKAAPYANLRRRQWSGTIGLVVCKFKPWDVKTIEVFGLPLYRGLAHYILDMMEQNFCSESESYTNFR